MTVITNAIWSPNTYGSSTENAGNNTEVNNDEIVLNATTFPFILFFIPVLVVPFVKAIVIMLIVTYQ